MSEPSLSYENGRSICLQKHLKPHKQYLNKIIYLNENAEESDKIYEIHSNNYRFEHLPDIGSRDCLYICGASGSGKTTYISKYLNNYKKIFKNPKIYLFSKLSSDETLDQYKPIRVDLNKFKYDDDTLKRLHDSLLIFDDIDSIGDKKIKDKIYNFINEVLYNGRHHNISIIITNHLCTDYKKTRPILNECKSVTFFCKSGANRQINYLLKSYLGLDKNDIERIMKLRSRWVTVFKCYPMTVLCEKGIYLL